jgi:predicted aspartyl protease
MIPTHEPTMGRLSVEVDLANNEDLVLAKAGIIPQDKVRCARIGGVVDTRAARLIIPEKVARQLGLESPTAAKVRYSNGQTAQRSIARAVYLAYGGRNSVFNAVVEPDRDSALIGAIVLEDLDLLVDWVTQRLVPRDPKQIISETE